MPVGNTIKKEEADKESQFADQKKAQQTKPKNFYFDDAINFEGIGEGEGGRKEEIRNWKLGNQGEKNFSKGGDTNRGKRSGFIKDLVGTQLPKSYDFKVDSANEEDGGEGREGEDGREGIEGEDDLPTQAGEEREEGREGGEEEEKEGDEFDEERKLNREKGEDRKKKEGNAEIENKSNFQKKYKSKLISIVFEAIFGPFSCIADVLYKQVDPSYKVQKWQKILRIGWVLCFFAGFLIFIVLIVAIKQSGLIQVATTDIHIGKYSTGISLSDIFTRFMK